MSWESNYKKAKRYGDKINPDFSQDLVHDAWLYWKENKGEDLFDVAEKGAMIYRVMKNIRDNQNSKENTYVEDSKKNSRVFYNSDYLERMVRFPSFTGIDPDLRRASVTYSKKTSSDTVSTSLDVRDIYNGIIEKINKMPNYITRKTVLDMKLEGYQNREISEILGISQAMVSYLHKTNI
jgi:hypothetical protein